MDDRQHRRFRLHPLAAYLREVGYVFIDFQGRMFRMPEAEFQIFRTRCAEGLPPGDVQSFRDVLVECVTAAEAHESFLCQEIAPHEN